MVGGDIKRLGKWMGGDKERRKGAGVTTHKRHNHKKDSVRNGGREEED